MQNMKKNMQKKYAEYDKESAEYDKICAEQYAKYDKICRNIINMQLVYCDILYILYISQYV